MSETNYESDVSVSSDENAEVSSNMDFTGKILKNYNIISELGRGSYSIVWLCYNISDSKYYALKVQNPDDYNDGIEEIKILKKLPEDENLLKLKESFIKKIGSKKFLCSAYNLCCGNLDSFIRKGEYTDGFELNVVKKIFMQIIKGLKVLHSKCKLTHCDMKTDNILLNGHNNKDAHIIELYNEYKFEETYSEAKKTFWTESGKSLDKIKKMKPEQKNKIRKQIHQSIISEIQEKIDNTFESSKFDKSYMINPTITIADFGAACTEDDSYEGDFGTRYYRAPEVILGGRVTNKVDIWAAGCILYELIVGEFLFDPIKDKNKSRDYYHLLEMTKVSGGFSKKFLKTTKYSKKYFDSNGELRDTEYREFYDWDELLEKIEDIEERSQITDLLKKMLSLNETTRINANDILQHPWLN